MASTSKPTETSDLPKTEEEEFSTGPFKILTESVKCAEKILINCRNNKKLFARVTYFDRHCNMTLLDVKEMWLEMPRTSKGQKGKPVARDKYIRAMILRGDSVILVVRRPNMF